MCHWERQAAARCRGGGDCGGPGIDALRCLWTERKAGGWRREEQICPTGKKQPPDLSRMALGFCTQALEFQIGQGGSCIAVTQWTETLYVPVYADSWYHPAAPQNHDCSSVWPDSISSAPSSSILRTFFPCNSSLARAAPSQLLSAAASIKSPLCTRSTAGHWLLQPSCGPYPGYHPTCYSNCVYLWMSAQGRGGH